MSAINNLFEVISKRFVNYNASKGENSQSYTNSLFVKGKGEIAKKIGEEASEVIVAYLTQTNDKVKSETVDLLYHICVMLVEAGIPIEEVESEVLNRIQNGKKSDKTINNNSK